jgi:hypothetical protein
MDWQPNEAVMGIFQNYKLIYKKKSAGTNWSLQPINLYVDLIVELILGFFHFCFLGS